MVYHVMKNGETLTDITGRVIKVEDAEPLYRFLHSINKKINLGKKNNTYAKKEVRV